ncbi:MAG: hypothetical protein IT335_06090, partial [Thermomicrobiales bacterium]|nr:hypothetical protein [Thermomicrobiales bacterium]
MNIALPIAIPWIAGILLALMDGRRRRPGRFAIAALVATMAAASNLAWEVYQNGPVEMVTGGWAPGVGITLRADMLGLTFALLSLGVLLAALTFEVLSGVRTSSFPALVLFLATGLTGVFITADAFNFYVFFEITMIAAYVLTSYGEDGRQ